MREGRRGIDRVRDPVELNLEREVDNIRNIQNRMQTTIEQVCGGGLLKGSLHDFFLHPWKALDEQNPN